MAYIIPDPRWEMPELLTPGRKPVGNVVIDWGHPLARGLKHYFLISAVGATFDLVTGVQLVKSNASKTVTNDIWKGEKVIYTGGGSVTLDIGVEAQLDITGFSRITMFCRCKRTTTQPFGRLMSIHYSGSDDFRIYNRTDTGKINYALDDGTPSNIVGNDYDTTMKSYALSHDGTTTRAYESGEEVGSASESVNFSSADGTLTLGEASKILSNSALSCRFSVAAVYDRDLSQREQIEVDRNPYQFLIPA